MFSKIRNMCKDKVKPVLSLWCGLGFIAGINGAVQESNRIVEYNYGQLMISDFDRFMGCVDDYIKATWIYMGIFVTQPVAKPLYGLSFFERIENCRGTYWLHRELPPIILKELSNVDRSDKYGNYIFIDPLKTNNGYDYSDILYTSKEMEDEKEEKEDSGEIHR